MIDKLRFWFNRLSERLWIRPLLLCIFSILAAFIARMADGFGLEKHIPQINVKSLDTLLSVISSSILVIATLAVASMVSAYASASSIATPRCFSLIVSDDVSQNALSTFIGAFIFSIVALISLENSFYEKAGIFALFILTLIVFAVVIVVFVKWVDCIARLGRLGNTINKVESATFRALERRNLAPTLYAAVAKSRKDQGEVIYGQSIGYIQHIDIATLQIHAENIQAYITLAALPGTFTAPDRPILYVRKKSDNLSSAEINKIEKTILIGDERKFDEDPRFGLVVLSEIASRALSPAINDPGTAIQIIAKFVKLFAIWSKPLEEDSKIKYDRVEVPKLSLEDMFDDAFTAISRDSANIVEVQIRLQRALKSLACINNKTMKNVAKKHSQHSLARVEKAMTYEHDIEIIKNLANEIQKL